MPYYITNTSGGPWSSASLTLAAGASITINNVTLPVDLSTGLVAGTLTAVHLTDPPLFTYEWAGFTERVTGLGSTTQYLALLGQNTAPSSSANQQVYANRAKRLYNLNVVLANAPGVGNTRTFTIIKNGSDTGLTVTFGAAEIGRKRISAIVDIADMDTLQLKSSVTGTPADSPVSWSVTLSNNDPQI